MHCDNLAGFIVAVDSRSSRAISGPSPPRDLRTQRVPFQRCPILRLRSFSVRRRLWISRLVRHDE
jgi:hypothetical protein